MKTLAIVPARGGSKRLKNKNIKFFFGKPILQRTFNIIKKSGLFDNIILTTDSVTIRNILCNETYIGKKTYIIQKKNINTSNLK